MDQHTSLLNADLPLIIEIEQPENQAMLMPGQDFSAFGWVLASEPVLWINVYLDGANLGRATLGIPRPDVAASYPFYPNNAQAGFWFSTKIAADKPAGASRLRFDVATGERTAAREVEVVVGPAGGAVAPAPQLDPIRLELEGVALDGGLRLKVSGWAASTEPLKALEIRIGDRLLGVASVGLPRPDVAAALPHYQNAGSAGFLFETQLEQADTESNAVSIHASDTIGRSHAVRGAVDYGKTLKFFCDNVKLTDSGTVTGDGWAVCASGIAAVRIELDETLLGEAEIGVSRPDVGLSFPQFRDAEKAGFSFNFDLGGRWQGDHLVRITVSGGRGEARYLEQRIRAVASALPPPEPQAPPSRETVHFFCDEISLGEDGTLAGVGWALCPSSIKAIAVHIDDTFACEAEIGVSRPDVATRFPAMPAARRAGYRFGCKLGGTWQGDYVARLTATAGSGETHTILQPVSAAQEAAGADPASDLQGAETEHMKFYLDLPAVEGGHAKEPTRGFTLLSGWAFARSGIAKIEVFIDGLFHANAFTGIRREDIQSTFPGWDALLSGFALLVPPQALKPGSHHLRIALHDNDGHFEEVAFTIDAEEALEGAGPWQIRRKMKQAEIDVLAHIIAASACRPIWTLPVLMRGTGHGEIARLRSTIESISRQGYADWKVIVHVPHDLPSAPEDDIDVAALVLSDVEALGLSGFEHIAPQIGFVCLDAQTALSDLAGPEGMLTWLDAGDCLGEDALLELTLEAGLTRRADFLYSDERRIDPASGKEKPFFKPDWSPDLLLSTNYIGRLWACGADLLRKAGLTLGDILERGEYDAVLRLTELAAAIHHVPKVLCRRRSQPLGQTGNDKLALMQAARRRGLEADVEPGFVPGTWRLKYGLARLTEAGALVSIIIPSIASRGLIKTTIESIRGKTLWPNIEIIVLDNIRATSDQTLLGWKSWMREAADKVIEIDEDFNWSRFNNIGAASARGDFLLFLNDDIEICDASWLHGLLEHAHRPGIGVVGPQLLYPDGRVQHAGVFLSGKVGRHAFRFYPSDAPGPFGLALTQRNVISVTGACMLTSREAFNAVGGFDEAHAVINNDLDFSLRLHRAGYRVVYTPHVTLTHHEMVSRSALKDIYNSAHFDAEWSEFMDLGDPYLHPLLARDTDDYLIEPEPLRVFQVGHPVIAHDNVRRILAVKVDHIGDFIAALPAFRRIKQHFPHAELCVLAARASLSLAALEPAIDRVFEFNFFHARSGEGQLSVEKEQLLELKDKLEPLRFDIALDLRRQTDTRKILHYTGARWFAGFDQDYTCDWLDIAMEFEGDVARNFKRSHVTDSLLQFVDVVANACSTDRNIIRHAPLPAGDAVRALAKLRAIRPIAKKLLSRPVVCIHAGAGAENKQWPARSFTGLINLLTGLEELNVLIIGSPDEATFTATVMDGVRHRQHVFSVVGKTSLAELPTVLLGCELFVGNDSGPKHMAAALGIPTIGIHSGSVDAGEWGPMGPLTMTLRREMTCGPCYIAKASDCPRSLACLTGIRVGDVFRSCQRMLALRPRPLSPPPTRPAAGAGRRAA